MHEGRILITGGAGFIGTWLTRALSGLGVRPIIVDSLLPQVHGDTPRFSKELKDLADCIHADVTDSRTWFDLGMQFPDIESIVHLAALTGTGQSMFDICHYDRANTGGCAAMAEAILVKSGGGFQAINQVVLASSRAVYGEGAYQCSNCDSLKYPALRSEADLAAQRWNPVCDVCGGDLAPVRTKEDAPHRPASFYGLTKSIQESYLAMLLGLSGVELTTLRFQNVYGPGQSLRNPYTGVIGIFYSRMLQNLPIDIFEDGEVTRDFVYVTDVVAAILSALHNRGSGVFNIGSGRFTRLMHLADHLRKLLASQSEITVQGKFRVGDIRHNAADIDLAAAGLGFMPLVEIEEGLSRYVSWAATQNPLSEAETGKANLDLRHVRSHVGAKN